MSSSCARPGRGALSPAQRVLEVFLAVPKGGTGSECGGRGHGRQRTRSRVRTHTASVRPTRPVGDIDRESGDLPVVFLPSATLRRLCGEDRDDFDSSKIAEIVRNASNYACPERAFIPSVLSIEAPRS